MGFPKRAKSSFGVPSSWGRCNAAANLRDVLLGEQLSEPPSGREVDFAEQKTEGDAGMWYEFVFHYELVNSDCALSLSHSSLVTAPSRKEPCVVANLCDVASGYPLVILSEAERSRTAKQRPKVGTSAGLNSIFRSHPQRKPPPSDVCVCQASLQIFPCNC